MAHQALILAAVEHVAKVSELSVKKSRSGMLMGILRERDNPERWDHVRPRLVGVMSKLSRHPIRDALERRCAESPKTAAPDPQRAAELVELVDLEERFGTQLDRMTLDQQIELARGNSIVISLLKKGGAGTRPALLRRLAMFAQQPRS